MEHCLNHKWILVTGAFGFIGIHLVNYLKPNGHYVRAVDTKDLCARAQAPAPIENPYSDFYDEEKARKLFGGFTLLDKWTTHHGKFGW